MVSTYTSYQLIMRDVGRSLDRVNAQPMVKRETEYFLANIGNVKSIDDLMNDSRLYNYAVKAHGLADMAYAKAFMRKALEGGISDPNSFANKLTDKRYFEFVKSFNFEALGADATTYNSAVQGTIDSYNGRSILAGVPPATIQQETAYYRANIVKVTSADELLKNNRLYAYVLNAYGLQEHAGDKALIQRVLDGGVDDPDSLAHTYRNGKFLSFARAFDFAGRGEAAITHVSAQQGVVSNYMRQTLEENAGAQNEGVRLALYFERKAATITSGYQILADPALAQVARTVLGLPPETAQGDIDRQAAMFEKRIDFADFKDTDKLGKFLVRFTTMWELSNGAAAATSPTLALFQPSTLGISTDAMLTLAQLKR